MEEGEGMDMEGTSGQTDGEATEPVQFGDGRDEPNNPNHCLLCGSRENSGVKFGFNPKRVSPTERIIHDVTHGCVDCDATWTAWGHHLIVPNSADDPPAAPTEAALAALRAAIKESGGLRIEVHPPERFKDRDDEDPAKA